MPRQGAVLSGGPWDEALYFRRPSPEWARILALWQRRWQRCAWCGAPYRDIDNMGTWSCAQHLCSNPRRSPVDGVLRWPCCGRPTLEGTSGSLRGPDPTGCVAADHRPVRLPWGHKDAVPLGPSIRASVPHPPRSLLDERTLREANFPPAASVRWVSRFDWHQRAWVARRRGRPEDDE